MPPFKTDYHLKLAAYLTKRVKNANMDDDGFHHCSTSVDNLHAILQTPPSYMRQFVQFQKRILDKIIPYLNDQGWEMSYHLLKKGRKAILINFKFKAPPPASAPDRPDGD